ncbi:MAG: hypothetical protein HRT69_02645 [Flavobacteriaceae bacterium]|nr:hypothetical protein [Flavobacteriaceae bacterium]
MKTLLFKPFERYSEQKLLITGVIATLIGALVTNLLNCKFIGVLKMTFIEGTSIGQSILDNIIILSCLILFLFLAGKYIYKKTRLIDIIVTALVAFIPLYLLPVFNINDTIKIATENILKYASSELANQIPLENLTPLVIFGFFTLAILVWFITLLYNGFKTASNAKGTKAMVVFGIALILADTTSRVLIHYFN